MSKRFIVDIPNKEQVFADEVFSADTKEEAIAWIRENIGHCDDDGNICLLTEVDYGDDTQEPAPRGWDKV